MYIEFWTRQTPPDGSQALRTVSGVTLYSLTVPDADATAVQEQIRQIAEPSPDPPEPADPPPPSPTWQEKIEARVAAIEERLGMTP